jgi:hypothetical protein
MKTLRVLSLVLLAVAATSTSLAAGKKADVELTNRSDWAIHHLYLSSVDEESWGPDQLGDEVLGTGDTFTLTAVPCDAYDVKLVDEDGDECVIGEVDVCGRDEAWVITSKDLLACQEASE